MISIRSAGRYSSLSPSISSAVRAITHLRTILKLGSAASNSSAIHKARSQRPEASAVSKSFLVGFLVISGLFKNQGEEKSRFPKRVFFPANVTLRRAHALARRGVATRKTALINQEKCALTWLLTNRERNLSGSRAEEIVEVAMSYANDGAGLMEHLVRPTTYVVYDGFLGTKSWRVTTYPKLGATRGIAPHSAKERVTEPKCRRGEGSFDRAP